MKIAAANAATNRRNIDSTEDREVGGFTATVHDIDNPHGFQLYVDGGMTPGPWVGVGINSQLYVLGWVPEGYPHIRQPLN